VKSEFEDRKFENIEQVIDYLYFKRPHGQVKLGMERIEYLVEKLGKPNLEYNTIHVAGTNGKGSVTRTLSTIFTEMGFTVGANYSPHLVKFNERITVNNENISDEEIVEVVNRLYPVIEEMDSISEEMKPSFFEIISAMGFEYFKMKQVDLAIIEVGLGGRYDATSVVHPDVCVITNVGFDHMKTLGNTLAKIAFEKSGIIKDFIPVVTGSEEIEALEVIREVSEEKKTRLHVLNEGFSYIDKNMKIAENVFDFSDDKYRFEDLVLNLNGIHQFKNCSVAIKAYIEYCVKNDIEVDENSLRNALKKVFWPGRLELVSDNPQIIVDGAHNKQGIDALVENWKTYFPGIRPILLTGMLSDKEFDEMTKKLSDLAVKVVVTEPNAPRETDTSLIVDSYKKNMPDDSVFYFKDHESACKKALELSSEVSGKGTPILVTGSLYVIGYLKEILLK